MTTVTGTVTDPDGFNWAGGSITASLVNNHGGMIELNGVPLTPAQLVTTAALDGSGAFSISLFDNTQLTPVGTQYNIQLCPNATAPCQNLALITISGGSMDLTSTIAAQLVALRFPASYTARAYGDVQISPVPPPGGTYWNVTSSIMRVWTGSAWVNLGGGGGGSAFSAITSGTNSTAAMVVGSGATLEPSGSGVIEASSLFGGTAGQIPYQTGSGTSFFGGTGVDAILKLVDTSGPEAAVAGTDYAGINFANIFTAVNTFNQGIVTPTGIVGYTQGDFSGEITLQTTSVGPSEILIQSFYDKAEIVLQSTFGVAGYYAGVYGTPSLVIGASTVAAQVFSDSQVSDTLLNAAAGKSFRFGFGGTGASVAQLSSAGDFTVAHALNAINGPVTGNSLQAINNSADFADLTLTGSTANNTQFHWEHRTADLQFPINTDGEQQITITAINVLTLGQDTSAFYSDLLVKGHLGSFGPKPTIAVQSGAGTGATATLSTNATDQRGQITITCNPTGGAAGAWANVTFAAAFLSDSPVVVFSPAGAVVNGAFYTTLISSGGNTTGFAINSGSAPGAAVSITINYMVMG